MSSYTKLDNAWLSEFLKRLPAAEAVLLYLQSRGNLRQKGVDFGQIVSALGPQRDARTVQRVVDALIAKGTVACVGHLYFAPEFAPAGDAAGTCAGESTGTLMAFSSKTGEAKPRQDGETPPLNKGKEGNKGNQSSSLRSKDGERARKTQEAEPTPFERMFTAIAIACYGIPATPHSTDDGVTTESRGRIGRAARSLVEAKYTPEDVPQVVTWIRTNEPWRTSALSPQVIAERATAWRAGAKGNLPLAAPGTTESAATGTDATTDMAALFAIAPLNGTRRKA